MGYKLTLAERETILRRAADEREWSLFSEDPAVIRKLDRLGYQATQETAHGKRYRLPSKAISFRRPNVRKRELSPERQEALRARMARMRAG